MKNLFSLLFCISLFAAQAQDFTYSTEDYDWDEARYSNVVLDDSTDLYYVLNKHLFYYFFEGNNFMEDYLIHKSVLLNSDDAIEGYNKVYFNQGSGSIEKFKARVINKDGSTRELDEDDILTGVDEESQNEYTYFALEGLEIGSQVEYYYIRRFNPELNGIKLNAQNYFDTERFEVDVICPQHLVFAGKAYNTDQEWKTDTTMVNETRIYFYADSLEGLKEEVSSFREANLVKVIFKLDANLYSGKKDLTSYGNIAQNVVNNVAGEISKKETKALKKIVSQMMKSNDDPAQLTPRQIEDFIKENYQFVNINSSEIRDIDGIYSNKAYNHFGGLKLFINLFKSQDIPYRIVYACDRSELRFDPEFESNVYLDEILFYLPEEDELMDVSSITSRMGIVSPYYYNQSMLMIEAVDLAGQIAGMASKEFLPAKKSAFTRDSLVVDVNFSEDMLNNTLEVLHTTTGYNAMNFQPVYNLITEEKDRKEYEEVLLQYIDEDAKVENVQISNGTAADLGIKPLVVKGTLTQSDFVDKAGPNYLFKVGELIGPQTEMYEEESDRKMDIETAYARSYRRIIRFEIPEGFEAQGLESLNMDEKMYLNDELTARFVSTYTREGNTVTVDVVEYYDEVIYPKENFEEYKKVINAAADFNKKTVLLEKKV